MTLPFRMAPSGRPPCAFTLVIADLGHMSATGAGERDRQPPAAVMRHCRAALAGARQAGIPATFVRPNPSDSPRLDGRPVYIWHDGFEPNRYESVLERNGPSCYDSPYFAEIIDGVGGALVLAGLMNGASLTATIADALHAKHSITILRDAVFDSGSIEGARPQCAHGGRGHAAITVISTREWLSDIHTYCGHPGRTWHG